jgi:hypothetical protein
VIAAVRNRRRPSTWAIALIGAIVLCASIWSATAAFAGSDPQAPYTVTKEGVTLPAGTTFPAGGHVNWRTDRGSYGIHFESLNNQPSGVYIGKSFLPFNLAVGECVEWVQVSLYNEHYGEGGQPPICNGGTPSTTEPSPSPSPSETPSQTSVPPTPSTTTPSTTTPSIATPPASTDSRFPTPYSTASTLRASAPDRLADTGTAPAAPIYLAVALLLVGLTIGSRFGARVLGVSDNGE